MSCFFCALNYYLFKINCVASPACICGFSYESVTPLPEMRDMRLLCTADFCMKIGYRALFIQRLLV